MTDPHMTDPHMTDPSPSPRHAGPSSAQTRRHFLQVGGAGLLTGAGAMAGAPSLARLLKREPLPTIDIGTDVDQTDLVLVMIKLDGGLDFLDAVIPTGGRYHDLRGAGALPEEGRLALDNDYTLHPRLPGLQRQWHDGRLAIVHGVGLPDNSLSHFVDSDVWARGRVAVEDGTGWLGRALDGLTNDTEPLVGVSIGDLSPTMYAPGWNPVALPDDGVLPWTASFIEENPGVVDAYQLLLGADAAATPLGDRVRASQRLIREVAETVDGATDLERVTAAAEAFDEEGENEEQVLGARLSLIADLINGGLPTRAYHVAFGDFDTHGDQATQLPELLGELDTAITAFQQKLGPNQDRVVIATWTEFGRRPDWNGNGTDHGTAGTHFVIGPRVRGGHLGEPASLHRFDHDQNFIPTTDFTAYLGGVAQSVLGVASERVLPGGIRPMELVA